MKNSVFLGLGGNIGDREQFLKLAVKEIEALGQISCQSSIIETSAWGITDQSDFLNMVLKLETSILPLELMSRILQIEQNLGRERIQKWGSRVIDIDILFFNDWSFQSPILSIPHPFVSERAFVLDPLLEIAPEFIHPKEGLTIAQLHHNLKNKQ